MAEETSAQTLNPEGWWERNFKNHLAGTVFICSFAGLLVTGCWALASTKDQDMGRQVFSILAPLFGTWVGTILTFYFTRENFKEANEAVTRLVQKVTPEQRLAQTPARDVMMPRASIRIRTLKEGENERDIPLRDLIGFYGKYSRLLMFNAGDVAKYVIHKSIMDAFLSDNMQKASAPADAANALDATFGQLLDYSINEELIGTIAKRFVFVKEAATLADARAAMLSVKGCEDVFVTKTGKADEPVLGWLTNTDIARDL